MVNSKYALDERPVNHFRARRLGVDLIVQNGLADHFAFARAYFVPTGAGRSSPSDQLRITLSWRGTESGSR